MKPLALAIALLLLAVACKKKDPIPAHGQLSQNRASEAATSPTVLKADCAKDGTVRISYTDGTTRTIPPGEQQVGCDQISVASSKHTVAWNALVENHATTYPIAAAVIVYRDGEKVELFTEFQMVWDWTFIGQGDRIAVLTGPVHGGAAEANLYDSRTGKVLEHWEGEGTPPVWASGWQGKFAQTAQSEIPVEEIEASVIRHAKALPASELDANLPNEPFETWLKRTLGPDAKLQWESNDCGEFDGSGRQTSVPICVDAKAEFSDGRRVSLWIVVGSLDIGSTKPEFSKQSGVWWADVTSLADELSCRLRLSYLKDVLDAKSASTDAMMRKWCGGHLPSR